MPVIIIQNTRIVDPLSSTLFLKHFWRYFLIIYCTWRNIIRLIKVNTRFGKKNRQLNFCLRIVESYGKTENKQSNWFIVLQSGNNRGSFHAPLKSVNRFLRWVTYRYLQGYRIPEHPCRSSEPEEISQPNCILHAKFRQ